MSDTEIKKEKTVQLVTPYIDIVFDGPPSSKSGRFLEVEDSDGKSISIGELVKRADGYWVLRIKDPRELSAAQKEVADLNADIVSMKNSMVNGLKTMEMQQKEIEALQNIIREIIDGTDDMIKNLRYKLLLQMQQLISSEKVIE